MDDLRDVDSIHYSSRLMEGIRASRIFMRTCPDEHLDAWHAEVQNPATQNFSDCPICLPSPNKEKVDCMKEHRSVETVCGRVFGYSCLREWFQKIEDCLVCRQDF